MRRCIQSLDEIWDDGDKNDGNGCLSDWSGQENEWYCTGGDSTQPYIWIEQCNDGYITSGEQWEDGNLEDLDGCDSSCQVETGWIYTKNTLLTSSVCLPIWGDGLIVGTETYDDGLDDTEGCNSNCNGEINGWYCTLTGDNLASSWVTQLMDGIRVNGIENWDDGNNIDTGDGWTNSGTIENKWIWNDNLLQRSICEPLWGDGVQDHPDEEWDDDNYDSGGGCSKDCIIESEWQWFNGSSTIKDGWAKQPIAEIDNHSDKKTIPQLYSLKIWRILHLQIQWISQFLVHLSLMKQL